MLNTSPKSTIPPQNPQNQFPPSKQHKIETLHRSYKSQKRSSSRRTMKRRRQQLTLTEGKRMDVTAADASFTRQSVPRYAENLTRRFSRRIAPLTLTIRRHFKRSWWKMSDAITKGEARCRPHFLAMLSHLWHDGWMFRALNILIYEPLTHIEPRTPWNRCV